MDLFLFYNSAMVRFTSSKRAARWLQPKASTQGLWLKQKQKPDTSSAISTDTFLQVTPSSHQTCFVKGDPVQNVPLGLALPSTTPARVQLEALSGVQSWAGLIRKKCSAIALALLMTPVSLLGFLSFSTTSIFSTADCLLLQSDCGSCARAWLAFSLSGQETKTRLPTSRTRPTERCCQTMPTSVQKGTTPVLVSVYTGHAGKLH